MFIITKNGPNRLDISMSGKLDAEGMKRALDELVSKAEGIEKGQLLYDVIDFHLPTMKAIAIEFSRFPSMLLWIRKFEKAAVLTDAAWLKKISELEGALVPGLEIKGFNRDQRAEAEAWLAG